MDVLNADVETLPKIIKKRIFLHLHTDKYAGASVEELAIVGELFKLWNEVKEQLNNSKNDDDRIWKKAPNC